MCAFSAAIGDVPPAAATASAAAAFDSRGVGDVGVPLPAAPKHFVKCSLFGFWLRVPNNQMVNRQTAAISVQRYTEQVCGIHRLMQTHPSLTRVIGMKIGLPEAWRNCWAFT